VDTSDGEPRFKLYLPVNYIDKDKENLLYREDNEGILDDYFAECILERAKITVGNTPRGLFNNAQSDVDDCLYAECDRLVENHVIGKLQYIEKKDSSHYSYKSTVLSIPPKLYNFGRDCEQSYVDGGDVILRQCKEFLQQGVWQIGFCNGKELISDINLFPLLQGGQWFSHSGELCVPVIWFGLRDQKPINIWSLPTDKNSDFDWKSFWFNDFWTMDWNALFGGYDDCYTVWMFCECGMEEPEEDFLRVKTQCPIDLSINDSSKQLLDKIQEYAYSLYNQGHFNLESNILSKSYFELIQESLKLSLRAAGKNIASGLYECNDEDADDSCRQPDGKLNKDWFEEGFDEQLQESYQDINNDMEFDPTYFGEVKTTDQAWDIFEKYLNSDIDDYLYEGLEDFIQEKYQTETSENTTT
jgi:hypothetical protein